MSDRLSGRVALVTGAPRGIGAAVARAFATAGASVALGHEPGPEAAERAAGIAAEIAAAGGRAVPVEGDLADPAAVEGVVERTRAELGPLDIVVANAADQGRVPWREITVEQWDHMHAVNVRGTWLLARAAHPDLLASEHASIITVTSVMVATGQAGSLHYTASKAAIIGLTRALAREVGPDAIRVNAVMPGAIRTEHEVELAPDADAAFERITAVQSLKRRGFADDLVGAFLFLAGDESAFVTGQVLNVDGGWVHY